MTYPTPRKCALVFYHSQVLLIRIAPANIVVYSPDLPQSWYSFEEVGMQSNIAGVV